MSKIDSRKACIYKATSKTTGLSYIGQSKDGINHRRNTHKAQAFNKFSKSKFHQAIRKLGWGDFEWSILKIIEANSRLALQDQLNLFERAYIKEYNSFENGYNMNEGGNNGVKYKYRTLEEKIICKRVDQRLRREPKKDLYNKNQRDKRSLNRDKFNKELEERRDKREALNPELKIQRLESHKEYMKENQQSRRAARIAKIGHEAYRAQFNERRRKRKEQKLLETNI